MSLSRVSFPNYNPWKFKMSLTKKVKSKSTLLKEGIEYKKISN
jgi:hypothetical protein